MSPLFLRKGMLVRALLFALLMAPLGLPLGCSKPTDSAKKSGTTGEDGKSDAKASAGKLDNASAVLEAMSDAYRKAKMYQDNGTVRLLAQGGGRKPIDRKFDFSVAFERPNKFHLDAYNVHVRCDGQKYFAFIEDVPNQIVEKSVPDKLGVRNLYGDPIILRKTMLGGPAGAPPQPVLLLEENVLPFLLNGADKPQLVEPGEIGDQKCYRVKIQRPEGEIVYWIDQESFLLRRITFSTEAMRPSLSQELGAEVESSSLIVELTGASFDKRVDPTAFEFEVPKDGQIQTSKYFIPAHPGQLVGKKTPAFEFTDDAGKSVTPDSLAGKTTAMLFWSPQDGDAKKNLTDFQKLYDSYKSEKNVAVFAVCLNNENFDKKAMEDMRQSLNLTLPIYRDLQKNTPEYQFFDVVYLLGPYGLVQDFEFATENDKLASTLEHKIEDSIAGRSLVEDAKNRYQKDLDEFAKAVEAMNTEEQAIPEEKSAERSEPKSLKLKSLWKCKDIKDPGNILVLNEPKRPSRLLVVSPPNQVVEVGLDGRAGKVHTLDLTEKETIANLRSFTTKAGKTYVAAFASAHQRLFLFDLEDKSRLIYPEDALENPHSGLADVELFDLDDNGEPEIYVGYWGAVGVHCVALDGKRLWGNRSLANVARMAATATEAKTSRRNLICTNILTEQNTSLFVLDAQGKNEGTISIGKRSLRNILTADLAGDGYPLWSAIVASKEGELLAIGFDLEGRELWNYRLTGGMPTRPIEPILAGRVMREGPGQWLFPCPDGSIHILSADGNLVDSFNYGAILQGLATVEIGGKPVILIASPGGLEALAVE